MNEQLLTELRALQPMACTVSCQDELNVIHARIQELRKTYSWAEIEIAAEIVGRELRGKQ